MLDLLRAPVDKRTEVRGDALPKEVASRLTYAGSAARNQGNLGHLLVLQTTPRVAFVAKTQLALGQLRRDCDRIAGGTKRI